MVRVEKIHGYHPPRFASQLQASAITRSLTIQSTYDHQNRGMSVLVKRIPRHEYNNSAGNNVAKTIEMKSIMLGDLVHMGEGVGIHPVDIAHVDTSHGDTLFRHEGNNSVHPLQLKSATQNLDEDQSHAFSGNYDGVKISQRSTCQNSPVTTNRILTGTHSQNNQCGQFEDCSTDGKQTIDKERKRSKRKYFGFPCFCKWFCCAIFCVAVCSLIAVLTLILTKTQYPSKSNENDMMPVLGTATSTIMNSSSGNSSSVTNVPTSTSVSSNFSTSMNAISSESITTDIIATNQVSTNTTSTPTVCSPTCSNGGTCSAPNTCYCPSTYTGATCSTPICSPGCSNGGTCSSPGVCTCLSTYTGTRCTIPICSPTCSNGGTCTVPNTCSCTSGWTGAGCNTTASAGCYHGSNQVSLSNGGRRSIEKLMVGDRIWNLGPDGKTLIEDEIVMMMEKQATESTTFYVIKSTIGHYLHVTNRHTLPVFDTEDNQTKIIRASQVTIKHYIFTLDGKIPIESIALENQRGFYSPLTLTGFLLVNNISTSIFSDTYNVSQEIFQIAFTPIRWYYVVMRFLYGKDYDPFQTELEYGLHPVIVIYKKYYRAIRAMSLIVPYIIPFGMICLVLVVYQKIFSKD